MTNPRNELLKVIEEAMDYISIGKPEAAMVTLWRVHSALRADDLVVSMRPSSMNEVNASIRDSIRKIAGTDKLPAMKPVNGKPKRLKMGSTLQVPCPRCGASKGDPCFAFTNPGRNGVPDTSKTIQTYHTARTRKAQASKRAIPQQAFEPIVVPLDEV